MDKEKGMGLFPILLSIVVVAFLGYVGWYAWTQHNLENKNSSNSSVGTSSCKNGYESGVVLMSVNDGVTPEQVENIAAKVGGHVDRRIGNSPYVLSVPAGHEKDAIQDLKMQPGVRIAEPSYCLHTD